MGRAQTTRTGKPKKEKDPNAPKRPLSSYMLFVQDRRPELANAGKKPTEIAKIAGAEWKELTADEKRPYEERAQELKAIYAKELDEYKNANK